MKLHSSMKLAEYSAQLERILRLFLIVTDPSYPTNILPDPDSPATKYYQSMLHDLQTKFGPLKGGGDNNPQPQGARRQTLDLGRVRKWTEDDWRWKATLKAELEGWELRYNQVMTHNESDIRMHWHDALRERLASALDALEKEDVRASPADVRTLAGVKFQQEYDALLLSWNIVKESSGVDSIPDLILKAEDLTKDAETTPRVGAVHADETLNPNAEAEARANEQEPKPQKRFPFSLSVFRSGSTSRMSLGTHPEGPALLASLSARTRAIYQI